MSDKKKEIKQKLKYHRLEADGYYFDIIGEEKLNSVNHLFENSMFDKIFQQNEERENKLISKSGSASYGVCISCKSTNNSLIPLQTRSADEPIDYFVKCNNCGKVWHSS